MTDELPFQGMTPAERAVARLREVVDGKRDLDYVVKESDDFVILLGDPEYEITVKDDIESVLDWEEILRKNSAAANKSAAIAHSHAADAKELLERIVAVQAATGDLEDLMEEAKVMCGLAEPENEEMSEGDKAVLESEAQEAMAQAEANAPPRNPSCSWCIDHDRVFDHRRQEWGHHMTEEDGSGFVEPWLRCQE